MGRCLDDVNEGLGHFTPPTQARPWLAMVAVALHGWYTALETALERIARAIDQRVPTGETWHRDLLSQCTAEIPSVRPAVLPRAALFHDLVELLEFRRFFRHAYGVSLDPGRLRDNGNRLLLVAPGVGAALDEFDAFLRTAQSTLAE